MGKKLALSFITVCVFAIAHAQFTAFDQEWLMDDPHKADRLPIWSQLLGNRGFMFNSRTNTQLPAYNTKKTSGKTANNWLQALQNIYKMYMVRQLLGNNRIGAPTTTTLAPPTHGTITTKPISNPWLNSLTNLYTLTVLNQFLRNQPGSNKNAK